MDKAKDKQEDSDPSTSMDMDYEQRRTFELNALHKTIESALNEYVTKAPEVPLAKRAEALFTALGSSLPSAVKSRLDELLQLANRVSELETRLVEQRNEILNLYDERQALRGELETLKGYQKYAQLPVSKLVVQITQQNTQISSLNSKIVELQQENAELKASNADVKASNARLETTIKNILISRSESQGQAEKSDCKKKVQIQLPPKKSEYTITPISMESSSDKRGTAAIEECETALQSLFFRKEGHASRDGTPAAGSSEVNKAWDRRRSTRASKISTDGDGDDVFVCERDTASAGKTTEDKKESELLISISNVNVTSTGTLRTPYPPLQSDPSSLVTVFRPEEPPIMDSDFEERMPESKKTSVKKENKDQPTALLLSKVKSREQRK